jgi:periplasmic protein TonB
LAQFDIAQLPRQPAAPTMPGKAAMGPPNLAMAGDSKRVGSAPNGEPLYAAAWYREPSDDELGGYLSTAQGPGWALIACRTVAEFRVEDCVGLDEYPSGSQIQRAVLAAAWQFRVRPPRLGGVLKVGEWVRIRIDYGIRRK